MPNLSEIQSANSLEVCSYSGASHDARQIASRKTRISVTSKISPQQLAQRQSTEKSAPHQSVNTLPSPHPPTYSQQNAPATGQRKPQSRHKSRPDNCWGPIFPAALTLPEEENLPREMKVYACIFLTRIQGLHDPLYPP